MKTDRRSFLRLSILVGAAPSVLALAGCDSDPDPGTDSGTPPTDAGGGADAGGGVDAGGMVTCNSVSSVIGMDHPRPHALTVPITDVTAGVDVTYDITGMSAHPHTLVVTAADWATLLSTGSVTVTSSRDASHTHVCTLTCMA
jgi:hypothetical protein